MFTSAEALALLSAAHAQDRLAHAYLITGPAGSGKRALAAALSSLILAQPGDTSGHPDVHIAEPESKSRRILIEQIRALEHELHMRSLLGGKKIGLILDADRLQPNAANAFLKTLEEPPAHTHLLLLTAQPGQMLETILSRCIEVPLRLVEKVALTDGQRTLLGALQSFARGGRAELPHVFGLVRAFQSVLSQAKAGIQAQADTDFKAEEKHYKQTTDARAWLDDREDYWKAIVEARYVAARAGLLETLEQWSADSLRQQHGSPELDLPEFAADTAALATRHSTVSLLRRADALEGLRENLNRPGVQEQLAIECAFLRAFGESHG